MSVTVFLADDHAVVRDGLKLLLESQGDIRVVGEATDGRQAVCQIIRLAPRVAILDIAMPELNGIEATHQIKADCPQTQVIILSMHSSPEHIFQALKAGARGYLLKDIRREELAAAIRKVHSGQIAISESIQSKVELLHEEKQDEAPEAAASTKIDELQLVLSPPVEAGQLMRFAGCAEERLKSRVLQMVGAWEEGTVMTLALHKATPLSTLMSVFKDIPEIRQISREPLDQTVNPKLLKKVMTGPRIENKSRATLYIALARN